MSRKNKQKTEEKNQVMKAFEHQEYDSLVENVDTLEKSEEEWWTNPMFVKIFTVVLAFADFSVLYSILDRAVTQAWYLGLVLAIVVAFMLNFLPVMIAKYYFRTVYKLRRMAALQLVLAIIGFLLLYVGTVYFRFTFQDMYGETAENHLVNNLESVMVQADSIDDKKSFGTVLFLSITPLITSLIALLLGFVSSDEVKRKRYKLRRMITQLDESIAELEASVSCRKRTEQEELGTDEKLMQLAVQDVEAKAGWMRSAARQYLTEYLQNPSAISVLSHELDNETRLLLEEALTFTPGGTEETGDQIPADRDAVGRGGISAFAKNAG
jgi:hypothetical protein